MWLKVGLDRSRRLAAVCIPLLLGASLAGCLGSEVPTGDQVGPADPEEPIQFGAGPRGAEGTIHLLGNDRIDRLARGSGWSGLGTLTEPYMVTGLSLQETTLVLENVTRSLHIVGAEISAPPGAPALLLLNVTGAAVSASRLSADDAPALVASGSEWVRIESSRLESATHAVEVTSSTAFDVIDNDLYAGPDAHGITVRAGGGNHWIEGNRIHPTGTAVHLEETAAPSLLIDNRMHADVGLHAIRSAGPYLEGNDVTADEGVVLDATHNATVYGDVLTVAHQAIRLIQSHDLYIEDVEIRGGSGLRATDSDLTLVNGMHYEGSGPAVALFGGHLAAIVDLNATLPEGAGDAVVAEETHETLVLASVVTAGDRSIVLERTRDAAVLENTLVGAASDAVSLFDTTGSLVASNQIEAVMNGTVIAGGAGAQIGENTYRAIFGTAVRVSDAVRSDVSFNRFDFVTGGIETSGATEIVIDHNRIGENSIGGIRLTDTRGAHLFANHLDRVGISVAGPSEDSGLLLEDNLVERARGAGVALDGISGFTARGNLLFNNGPGLRLHDTNSGSVFDNYFENGRLNVVVTGTIDDIAWYTAQQEGPNVVGGGLIGGNWWHDYTGADSDDDGFGDIPYGVIPYDRNAQQVMGQLQSYGVEDELPLADTEVPLTASGPTMSSPPGLAEERLGAFTDHHPRLGYVLNADG